MAPAPGGAVLFGVPELGLVLRANGGGDPPRLPDAPPVASIGTRGERPA